MTDDSADSALNDRQRRFAELLVEGRSATSAYIDAGYAEQGAEASASRLLSNAKVAAYVAILRAASAKAAGYTLEAHIERLRELAEGAVAANQFAAAITAEVNRGKVSGFYVEKVEDVTKMAPDQREQRVLTLLTNAQRRKQA